MASALLAGTLVVAVVLLASTGSNGRHRPAVSAGAAATPGPPKVTSRNSAHGGSRSLRSRIRQPAGSIESRRVRKLISLGRAIYCAGTRGNEVALTFDDGPGPYTRLVINKLRKHGVHATFFIVGRNIPLVPGAVRQERAQGAVGDHTFTHPVLTTLAKAAAEREIAATRTALKRSSGGPVFLFRPPYGARSASIDSIVRANGMLDILWNVDSADSLGANYAQIERNVIGGLRAGSIILMHENHGQTVRALPNIFAALKRRHLRAVSVPKLLTDDPPSLAQVRAGGSGCRIHARPSAGGH